MPLIPSIALQLSKTSVHPSLRFCVTATDLLQGTTQGDPLAMPMYALATVPLIAKLSEVDSVSQTWFADDASACGKLPDVYNWWNLLSDIGPTSRMRQSHGSL